MTDQPAAFKASFHSLRSVVGRKQIQLVFEVPNEQLGLVASILEQDNWYGIAKLDVQPAAVEPKPKNREAQRAAILCDATGFHRFLLEKHQIERCLEVGSKEAKDAAADFVRDYCGVDTRADLDSENKAWKELSAEYELWLRS